MTSDPAAAGASAVQERLAGAPWSSSRQVHGSTVIEIGRALGPTALEADGIVTAVADTPIAMFGADCALIAFASREGPVGIAHAGWKGLTQNVIGATVDALRALGASEIHAATSPMIGPECYEFSPGDLDAAATAFGEQVRVDDQRRQARLRPARRRPGGASACRCRGGHLAWRLHCLCGRLVLLEGSARRRAPRARLLAGRRRGRAGEERSAGGARDVVVRGDPRAPRRGCAGASSGAGGDPAKVRIVAVAKTFPAAAIKAALAAGVVDFGENYADELRAKAIELADEPAIRWRFIGAIQRNKLARLAPFVACYEGVTRIDEGRDIARRAPGASVFVEVDTTGLAGRNGVSPTKTPALVEALREVADSPSTV